MPGIARKIDGRERALPNLSLDLVAASEGGPKRRDRIYRRRLVAQPGSTGRAAASEVLLLTTKPRHGL